MESVPNLAFADRLSLSLRDVGAVPKDDRVAGVERQQELLIVVVLQVPNSLLVFVGVCPHSHAIVLSLLRVAILNDVRDLWDVPNTDATLNTRCEEKVLVW